MRNGYHSLWQHNLLCDNNLQSASERCDMTHGIHTPLRTPYSITWQTSEQSVISVSLLFSELGAPADLC